jgi:chromatin remodeling complex protein RSC6
MPKQVKKNSTEVAETTTPAVAVVAAAAEPKAVKPKAVKKAAEPKAVATKAVEVEVKIEAAAVESASTTATPAVADDVEAALAAKSAEFSTKLSQLASLITTLKSEFKTMEKNWSKELKAAQKISSKKKRKSGNRAPSGFVKPALISDELAKFLEKPAGTQMARTDVTRQLNTYIRANSLQDKENGRKINPDAKLQALLKLKKTDELTYFNLQRYMSPHFPKAEVVVA